MQATGISQAQLNAIYAALGVTSTEVLVTDGTQQINVTSPNEAILLSQTASQQQGIANGYNSSTGVYENIGQQATYVINNNTGTPLYIVGTDGNTFVEYTGPDPVGNEGATTIDGGISTQFVADASHTSANVIEKASNVAGAKNELLGSNGMDTIYGATDTTAAGMSTTTVIHAGTGPTVAYAGTGSATIYGGGATTMFGGSHAGQALEDFTAGAHDSIQAGTGGTETLAVAHGTNTLDDTAGDGTDSLFGGDGNDTLFGSSAGTQMFLGNGVFDISSSGADTITVTGSNSGVDTISGPTTANVFDTVHFASSTETAAQLNAAVASAPTDGDGGKTITFTTAGGTSATQTVHLLNATHITFT